MQRVADSTITSEVAAPARARARCTPRRRLEMGIRTRSHRLDPERLSDHIDALYRAARALCGSQNDAEDLVQETFAKVLRRALEATITTRLHRGRQHVARELLDEARA